ncbi:MAG: hypothetical protein WC788_04565 [Candidatus Paceibacterota bacterium]|jgi:hypothetical protein
MSKNQKGSNERQLKNEARRLLAMPEDEREAKLSLMRIVKSDKAERINQLIAEIMAESAPKKESEEKPAEVTVVEETIKTEPEAVPAVDISEEVTVVEEIAETKPEVTLEEEKPAEVAMVEKTIETEPAIIPQEEKAQQEEKPAEVTVIEKITETEPKAVPEEEKPAEVEPETKIPGRNAGHVLWEGKKEEPKKERRIKKNNKVKMLTSSVVRDEPEIAPRKAFIVSLEEIMNNMNGDAHINALHSDIKGMGMSMSTHAAFLHKKFGKMIPVIIQTSTVPHRRQPSRQLYEKDVGSWVRENVPDWKNGVWFMRIGHTNIVSDKPLNVNKDIKGYVLISSKKVEQAGRLTQYFPHIIVLGTEERIVPAFRLSINDEAGNADESGAVHIGPTVSAMRDDKEVKEYLHLEPINL